MRSGPPTLRACALAAAVLATALAAAVPAAAQTRRPQEDAITLYEGGICSFGECPIFEITIFEDGTFFYFGVRNVESVGAVRGAFGPATYAALRDALDAASFDHFDNYYGGREICRTITSDMPNVRITYQRGGNIKSVYHDLGCGGFDGEKELRELETMLFGIARRQWETTLERK